MSKKIVHILGNGDSAQLMPESWRYERDGKLLICNIPPFEVQKVYACCMVDFKMMRSLHKGEVNLDSFKWVLGNRPKLYCQQKPDYYMKHAHHIREFYTTVPKYCGPRPDVAATNFNCGHFATHYAMRKHQADEVHLYGFDSIMDHNMRSYTDVVLPSDRNNTNNYKLLDIWRPIWTHMFKEFKDRQFVIHYHHSNPKIKFPDNVRVQEYRSKK